jgi:hypothetical protein
MYRYIKNYFHRDLHYVGKNPFLTSRIFPRKYGDGAICFTVTIGSSESNSKSVNSNEASGFSCPSIVNKHNWLTSDSSGGIADYVDHFSITVSGSQVQATRTDSTDSWVMNLQISCCHPESAEKPMCGCPTNKGFDGTGCVACGQNEVVNQNTSRCECQQGYVRHTESLVCINTCNTIFHNKYFEDECIQTVADSSYDQDTGIITCDAGYVTSLWTPYDLVSSRLSSIQSAVDDEDPGTVWRMNGAIGIWDGANLISSSPQYTDQVVLDKSDLLIEKYELVCTAWDTDSVANGCAIGKKWDNINSCESCAHGEQCGCPVGEFWDTIGLEPAELYMGHFVAWDHILSQIEYGEDSFTMEIIVTQPGTTEVVSHIDFTHQSCATVDECVAHINTGQLVGITVFNANDEIGIISNNVGPGIQISVPGTTNGDYSRPFDVGFCDGVELGTTTSNGVWKYRLPNVWPPVYPPVYGGHDFGPVPENLLVTVDNGAPQRINIGLDCTTRHIDNCITHINSELQGATVTLAPPIKLRTGKTCDSDNFVDLGTRASLAACVTACKAKANEGGDTCATLSYDNTYGTNAINPKCRWEKNFRCGELINQFVTGSMALWDVWEVTDILEITSDSTGTTSSIHISHKGSGPNAFSLFGHDEACARRVDGHRKPASCAPGQCPYGHTWDGAQCVCDAGLFRKCDCGFGKIEQSGICQKVETMPASSLPTCGELRQLYETALCWGMDKYKMDLGTKSDLCNLLRIASSIKGCSSGDCYDVCTNERMNTLDQSQCRCGGSDICEASEYCVDSLCVATPFIPLCPMVSITNSQLLNSPINSQLTTMCQCGSGSGKKLCPKDWYCNEVDPTGYIDGARCDQYITRFEIEGPCTIGNDWQEHYKPTDGGACFQSPNYPQKYDNNQACTIKAVSVLPGAKLMSDDFYVSGGDYLQIGDRQYPYYYKSPDRLHVNAGDEMYWFSDGSTVNRGFKVCMRRLPNFEIKSGPCTVNGACFQSPQYPSYYGNGQSYGTTTVCEIEVGSLAGFEAGATLMPIVFNTHRNKDILTVNGIGYSGTSGPSNTVVEEGDVMRWFSGGRWGSGGGGWKICLGNNWCATSNSVQLGNDCSCGMVTCNKGKYCHTDNTCKDGPKCTTHNSVQLSNDCMCGSVTCNGGKYCITDNFCSDIQACATDNTVQLSNDCMCGSDTCAGGKYCHTDNTCKDTIKSDGYGNRRRLSAVANGFQDFLENDTLDGFQDFSENDTLEA